MMNFFSTRKLLSLGSALVAGLFIWAGMSLQSCSDGDGFFDGLTQCNIPIAANLDTQTRIGGASTVVTLERGDDWTLYNVANELRATQSGLIEAAKYTFPVAGFIQDIDVVEYPADSGTFYALVSMGGSGITVVDVTDPTSMFAVTSVHVNFEQTGITWADGGGNVTFDNTIAGVHAPITSLEMYDDGVNLYLLIGNEDYGLHRTLFAHLLDPVAGREADGTLLIDDGNIDSVDEVYTLQYAGENPWGGPKSMQLYKDPADAEDKGKLFVAMGFLGIGIFNPDTMQQIGGYNLYTDVSSVEDWFIDMDVATQVSADPDTADLFLDDFTGMPDYRQAEFEVAEVWHNKVDAPAPWAAFDRYGKYYYDARNVDVATFGGNTTAYIAYGLGGIVAVDVTGYKTADIYDPLLPDPFANFRKGQRLGYAPAVPANGPGEPTGASSESLYPHFGSGMLKESGVVDVQVDIAGNRVFFSDHFAGLVVMGDADDPSKWHGPNGAGAYMNDTMPPLGDHWPDYEFVTSYDMSPYDPLDNESLPTWMFQSPSMLVSGEVSGHGNRFVLSASRDVSTAGQVDVVMASGGGGISYVDVIDLNAPLKDGFMVLAHMATTDEIYREADGTKSVGAAIGHTAGVAAYRNLLFLADGPHGMTVWKIADEKGCFPTDDVHLIANTLQDEYAVDTGTEIINPTPHAYDVILDTANDKAYVMSLSRGLRRVDVDGINDAKVPVLLKPLLSDIYEHNTGSGSVGGLSMQDHAYDVVIDGNLAFVADGSNGLTVYDISKDPSTPLIDESYVVGNIGGETTSQPPLGHATGVKLWKDAASGKKYAFVASGHAGIGVVDVTDAADMVLVKVFEPVKIEEEEPGVFKYGKADGKSVDVLVVDQYVYFTYDSFGMVVYTIADLIKPLPDGMDPTKIWTPGTIGERPEAVARFKLQDSLLGGSDELADLSGGAQGMFAHKVGGKHLFYVAYDAAGVAKIDWSNVANPKLVQHANTAGAAADVEVVNGRAYVADGAGGLVLMK